MKWPLQRPGRLPMKRLAIVLLLGCFALGAAASEPSVLLPRSGEARVGQPVPWLSGWTLDNQVFNINKTFDRDPAAKRLAIVFWTTVCPLCLEEMAVINAAKARLDAAGVRVVYVNFKENGETVQAFIRRHPALFPVVGDPYGSTEKTFHDPAGTSVALPRTFVVGRDRRVLKIIGGIGNDFVDQIVN